MPVLIQLYVGAPYVGDDDAWGVMPKLVVYADGRVIFTPGEPYGYDLHTWHNNLQIAYLPPNETCSLLTKINTSGFFDFNQDDYIGPDITDGGSTTITVQAWRSHSVRAYEIQTAENLQPALKEPYTLLSTYNPPNALPYYPDQVALLISFYGDFNRSTSSTKPEIWPANLSPIEKLSPVWGGDAAMLVVLSEQEAAGVYNFFDDQSQKWVEDHGKLYRITFRPVLPHEIVKSMRGWQSASFEESPKMKLTCILP